MTERSAQYPYFQILRWAAVLLCLFGGIVEADASLYESVILQLDSPQIDLVWPINDPPAAGGSTGNINLQDPTNIENEWVYDPVTGQYVLQSTVGSSFDYRPPMSMSLDEYLQYDMEKAMQTYWLDRVEQDSESGAKGLIPDIKVRGEAFDRIFGGNTINIRPQGSAEVIFGINTSRTDNPRIPVDQRSITTFNFDQRIQMNLVGNIGDKLKISTSYNTEATFDFENQVKLDYTGYEDEIIQKIEAGNVSLPLNGTLIQGSQSLFGLKTELRFGKLTATAIWSQEKGQRRNVQVAGGAQTSNFNIKADEYEANKHYFLSYFFREQYEAALRTLPTVNSGIQITRIEVWLTNTRAEFEQNRNLIAFTDLGESIENVSPALAGSTITGIPGQRADNAANSLYAQIANNANIVGFINSSQELQALGFQAATQYEKLESARLLAPNEYTYNERLGFISLNQSLNNDEVLAVSYQYTFQGQTYQVGQFSTDGVAPPNALVMRLLKSTITDPRIPLWDLMMKNVYALGAFQVNRDDFRLDLVYNNPATGVDINYVPRAPIDEIPLLQALGMDRLDPNNAPNPDGWFDFIDQAATIGGTINAQNGRVFFPVLEPFGSFLDNRMIGPDPNNPIQPDIVRKNIVYQALYDSTKTAARNQPELNRFSLKGSYRSASSDVISLNSVNIPQGSVSVTAGGVRLVENQDYTVDYNLGRVRILNQGLLEAGTPINISLESNSLFSIQTKTLAGARFDYRVNKELTVGGTVMNLYERPLTQKVNVGDEPIANTVIGLDGNWRTESQAITNLVDKLPFFATKEISTVNASGEAAYLIPGHSNAIGKNGVSYIDDFEGSVSTIDLRTQSLWNISATPQGQPDAFPEGDFVNDLRTGERRAKLAWYVIDPLFFRNNNLTPPNITGAMQSDNRMREVLEQEVFPNRQLATGTPANIPVLDLAYYPSERGPYNYNTALNPDGTLPNPQDQWAGITRRVTTTDFEASNIEVIQFWVMDPFTTSNVDSDNSTGGELFIDLGNIGEDVMRDGRKAFENGLPKNSTDQAATTDDTNWGIVPTTQSIVNAFAITDDNSNRFQDVGLDGLSDKQADIEGRTEQGFFSDYINALDPGARAVWQNDPSADNYHFFRGSDYDAQNLDILERYKEFNGLEGNSITDEDSPESYPTQQSVTPSTEDINQDQNLSESESYFEYKINLRPSEMVVGQNFITDRILGTANTPDGPKQVYWYQFKVPVRLPDKVVNGIQDFRSIRFMRIYMKGWQQPAVLRFARLEFVRGEWRKYNFSLETPGEVIGGDPDPTVFETAAVNIEENGTRTPINYVIPPGINQEVDVSSSNLRNLNEQSLQMVTCNLRDGDARASFRNVNFDIRSYKKMRMYIHAEGSDPNKTLKYGDISVFVRLGNDLDNNYYEYEVPVIPSAFGNNDPYNVWPESNNMIIDFATLNDAKQQRDQAGYPSNERYMEFDGDRRIFVRGNPNLSKMSTIMIGIRNPKKDGVEANPWATDDAQPQCAQVWVNELRLTDFDQSGGWAAIARLNTTLADLGNLNVAGNYSTPYWGSIDKRVSERQRDTRYGVDISSNLELGKFLPKESGVRVPFYAGFAEEYIDPQFDPLSPDILWDDATRTLTAAERREQLKKVRTYTRRRSFNFTNVRKERTGGNTKEHLWDVENLALTYAYSDREYHDVNTAYENERSYRGSLAFNHAPKPKLVKPFENVSFLSSNWLKLIREFNFYLGLKQLNMRTSVDRTYIERLIQPNPDIESLPQRPTYNKTFNWDSQYGFRYELTKSLKLDFNANNNSVIGETPGIVNPKYQDTYQAWKDSVLRSVSDWGEATSYNQTINLTYQLPLDKIPLTDWITANTTYAAGYQWNRAPFQQDSIGGVVQNSQNISLNGQFNFINLYNKSKYLKGINDKGRGRGATTARGRGANAQVQADPDSKGGQVNVLEGLARLIMMIRNGTFTYSQNSGTLLPGYTPTTNMFGMSPGFSAPGFGFVLGQQNHNLSGDIVRDFATTAAEKGWLTKSPSIFNPYTTTRTESINARLTLEPIKSLRIELLANRTYSKNQSSFFRYNVDSARYVTDSPRDFGSFSVSTITWGTTFTTDDENAVNPIFQTLLDDQFIISGRLASARGITEIVDTTGFFDGYGATSQDVVIPAFLAAYTGKDAGKVKLDPFSLIPLPNWDITYDGLSRLKPFTKWFRTFTMNHSYRSTFNIGTYQSNLLYTPDGNTRDAANNFLPQQQITVVTISEVMRPFINFDATLKNSLLAKFEYNRDRSLSLSLSNYQVTEVRGKEFVIGTGYRFKNVNFPIAFNGVKPKSDMNLRVDVSFRDNSTVIRKMQEQQNQVTAGQNITSIKLSADYVINQRLNVRFFYERVMNNPVISTSFPSANTSARLSIRFTLTQ